MTNSDRRVALSIAGAITTAAWALTIRSAGTMSGAMPIPGGWSMSMAWMPMGDQPAAERAAMFLAMWTVMMVAMMLPLVMPVVLLHRRLIQSRREREDGAAGIVAPLSIGSWLTPSGVASMSWSAGVWIGSAAT